jgi:hypothetical protein
MPHVCADVSIFFSDADVCALACHSPAAMPSSQRPQGPTAARAPAAATLRCWRPSQLLWRCEPGSAPPPPAPGHGSGARASARRRHLVSLPLLLMVLNRTFSGARSAPRWQRGKADLGFYFRVRSPKIFICYSVKTIWQFGNKIMTFPT